MVRPRQFKHAPLYFSIESPIYGLVFNDGLACMTATPWLNQTRFSRSPASANAQEAAVQAIMNLNETLR